MTTMTKADFIRANSDLTPAQIVAKAKARGIELSADHVYTQRSQDKKNAQVARKPTTNGKPTAAKLEREFVALAIDMGLQRASALIGKVRAAAHA